MIWEKIEGKYLSIYLLISGIIILFGIDWSYYSNNFFENSRFPLMDILHPIFYLSFVIAGVLGVFFKKKKLTDILIYLTVFTISVSGFNYFTSGVFSFIVGIYYKANIIFASDFSMYGGFSFYYNPEESSVYGIGINLTSIFLILISRKIKTGKE